jgi:hypothetical protein
MARRLANKVTVLVPLANLHHVAKVLAARQADELPTTRFVHSAIRLINASLTHSGLEHTRKTVRQSQS